jgi:hypothetical protein
LNSFKKVSFEYGYDHSYNDCNKSDTGFNFSDQRKAIINMIYGPKQDAVLGYTVFRGHEKLP